MLQPCEIKCTDCGQTFQFTQEEAEYYNSKSLDNLPKRCKSCRQVRKDNQAPRQMFPVTCAQCGKATTVPFEPKPDRPVYCSECYKSRQTK